MMLSPEPSQPAPPRVIWCVTDHKVGHLNQMQGLVDALGRHVPVHMHLLDALPWRSAVWALLRKRLPKAFNLPRPDLILGAGHRTHWTVLAARQSRGGRAVVLMKPTLPRSWFDLCLIPQHDGVPAGGNVIATRGALNKVQPSHQQQADRGLILLGGPSRHHNWDDAGISEQIRTIVQQDSQRQWQLTTSRRTPSGILSKLAGLGAANLQVVPFEKTTPDWVPGRLTESATVWVSEDSVSMVYEALTSGAAVGLLSLPRRGQSRVVRGLDHLSRDKLVTRYDQWQNTGRLHPPTKPLWEADRCARLIIQRYGWG